MQRAFSCEAGLAYNHWHLVQVGSEYVPLLANLDIFRIALSLEIAEGIGQGDGVERSECRSRIDGSLAKVEAGEGGNHTMRRCRGGCREAETGLEMHIDVECRARAGEKVQKSVMSWARRSWYYYTKQGLAWVPYPRAYSPCNLAEKLPIKSQDIDHPPSVWPLTVRPMKEDGVPFEFRDIVECKHG